MRQFMMTAPALTAFGTMMAIAQAESVNGGPTRNGDQCFKHHGFSKFPRIVGLVTGRRAQAQLRAQ
jgi:hypothetical protein